LFGWLVGWLVGWVGWLAGWLLVGFGLVALLVDSLFGCYLGGFWPLVGSTFDFFVSN
jgi:hypothetical protein